MEPLIWEDYEFTHTKKSADWYWAVGIVSAALVVTPLFFNNIILSLLIAIGSFSLILLASKAPKLTSFEINTKGVRIDKHFFPYDSLDAFCVSDETPEPIVYIQSHSFIMPLMVIPVGKIGEDTAHQALAQHLAEKELREPLLQKVLEHFGF